MKIKIYGERNSGTNYLEKLIGTNLEVEILKFQVKWWSILLLKSIKYDFIQDFLWRLQVKQTLGWKHGCVPIEAIKSYNSDSLVIVTITKNPCSFLCSLYNNPYHIKGEKPSSFSSFICQKWITRRRDLCSEKHLDSPIDLWNLKNRSYVDLKNKVTKVVINITYEQLIKNPEHCIRLIASRGNIEFANHGHFQNCLTSTKDSNSTYQYYKEYYLREKWMSEYSDTDLAYLNPKISGELIQYFNYNLLHSEKTKSN